MAWPTMHFAMGMGCAGVVAGMGCMLLRRGWRWIPIAMTLGGIWATVPDLPRTLREDIYIASLSPILGSHDLERSLHAWGDLFFFHRALDAQPHELALLCMVLILVFYNAAILLLLKLERTQRNSLGNRAWRAHRSREARFARRRAKRYHPYHADHVPGPQERYANQQHTPAYPSHAQGGFASSNNDMLNPPYDDNQPAVIYRIGPNHATGTDDNNQ